MKRRPADIDTAVIYCGDNIDELRRLPDGCVDLIYIDPPFNSNRNYEVFWGETKERRASKRKPQSRVEGFFPLAAEYPRQRRQFPAHESPLKIVPAEVLSAVLSFEPFRGLLPIPVALHLLG